MSLLLLLLPPSHAEQVFEDKLTEAQRFALHQACGRPETGIDVYSLKLTVDGEGLVKKVKAKGGDSARATCLSEQITGWDLGIGMTGTYTIDLGIYAPQEEVSWVIKHQMTKECTHPRADGKVVLGFGLEAGRIGNVHVLDTELPAEFARCLAAEIQTYEFPVDLTFEAKYDYIYVNYKKQKKSF